MRRRICGAAAAAAVLLVAGCALLLGGEPNAPVGVVLQQLATGEVRVEWVDTSAGVRSETGFRIERRIDADPEFAERATVGANETRFDDGTALPGLTYWYRVAAYNDEADSGGSAAAQITVLASTVGTGATAGSITGSGMLRGSGAPQIIVSGDLLIDTYDATSGDTSVEGNWDVPNFIANGGAVWFQNSAVVSTIYGSNVWFQLLSDTPGKGLLFEAGETQTVTDAVGFSGSAGDPVHLLSTEAGERWTIDNAGANASVDYVVVQDSEVLTSSIVAADSLDAGNNDVGAAHGWVFQ